MRPKALSGSIAKYSRGLALSVLTLIGASQAPGATYYWDVNGSGASGFSTVVGGWNGTNVFWNTSATGTTGGTTTATTLQADDLIIPAATTNTGIITVTGTQNAGSITFASGVGAVTISGGTAINIGGGTAFSGIFDQSTVGAQTISTALILNSATTAFNFSNSGTQLLTIGAVTGAATSGTQTITVGSSSSGNITLNGIIADVLGSASKVALTINNTSTGVTTLSVANTFTGTTTISAGILSLGNSAALQNSTLDTTNSILGGATDGLKTTAGASLTLGGLTGNKDLASVFTTVSGGVHRRRDCTHAQSRQRRHQ